jgi:hypothetical protein
MLSLVPEKDFDVRDLSDDAVIWRYMDLSKFLWTLTTSSLYFVSLAKLAANDPYEGALPPAYREEFCSNGHSFLTTSEDSYVSTLDRVLARRLHHWTIRLPSSGINTSV